MTDLRYPRIGVLAVVQRSGAFLLVQRKYPPNQGVWGFPGGKLEWGETLAEGAARELLEETGLTARFTRPPLTPIEAIGTGEDFHFILIPMVGEGGPGEAVAADDALAVGWYHRSEMLALPRAPRVLDLTDQVITLLNL